MDYYRFKCINFKKILQIRQEYFALKLNAIYWNKSKKFCLHFFYSNNNLGYINYKLAVHCNEGSKIGKIDTSKCQYICLTNNQVIVINDEYIEIIE